MRRSLTLLEVLLASLLLGGLFAILLRSWIQIEGQTSQHARQAMERSRHEMAKFWILDHLSQLVVREQDPCLIVEPDQIRACCNHGTHADPRLAGPVQLRFWCQSNQLWAQIQSDPWLWKGEPLIEQIMLLEGVSRIELRAFGRRSREEQDLWHEGLQEWKDPPRWMECLLHHQRGLLIIPVFVHRGSS
jgi:hypothetical protein